MSAIPSPGFVEGQLVPASVEAMVGAQAETVRSRFEDGSFALLGHSSGGLLAHAVAAQLEAWGTPATAVVLIDTYPVDARALAGVTHAGFVREQAYAFVNDVRLTAMGAYLRLLSEWEPDEIATPVLLARASEAMAGIPVEGEWKCSWRFSHEAIDLAGHHFSVMEEQADATARAVHEWLSTKFEQQGVTRAC